MKTLDEHYAAVAELIRDGAPPESIAVALKNVADTFPNDFKRFLKRVADAFSDSAGHRSSNACWEQGRTFFIRWYGDPVHNEPPHFS